jgi:hypothetical protein
MRLILVFIVLLVVLVEVLPEVADGLRVLLAAAYILALLIGAVAFATALLGYW